MSVLPKNRRLVFSIRNCIRDSSEIFSISSLVKISLISFLCFFFVFHLFFFYFRSTHIYVIKRKLHVGLMRSLVNSFFLLEDKLHMFSIYPSPDNPIHTVSKSDTSYNAPKGHSYKICDIARGSFHLLRQMGGEGVHLSPPWAFKGSYHTIINTLANQQPTNNMTKNKVVIIFLASHITSNN